MGYAHLESKKGNSDGWTRSRASGRPEQADHEIDAGFSDEEAVGDGILPTGMLAGARLRLSPRGTRGWYEVVCHENTVIRGTRGDSNYREPRVRGCSGGQPATAKASNGARYLAHRDDPA